MYIDTHINQRKQRICIYIYTYLLDLCTSRKIKNHYMGYMYIYIYLRRGCFQPNDTANDKKKQSGCTRCFILLYIYIYMIAPLYMYIYIDIPLCLIYLRIYIYIYVYITFA